MSTPSKKQETVSHNLMKNRVPSGYLLASDLYRAVMDRSQRAEINLLLSRQFSSVRLHKSVSVTEGDRDV